MIKTFLAGVCLGLALALLTISIINRPDDYMATDRIIFGTDTITIKSNYGCSMDFSKCKGVKHGYWNEDRTVFTDEIIKLTEK